MVDGFINLANWKTVNCSIAEDISDIKRTPQRPIVSFQLKETAESGQHWCYWPCHVPDGRGAFEYSLVVRDINAAGLRVRMGIGNETENVWVDLNNLELSNVGGSASAYRINADLIMITGRTDDIAPGTPFSFGLMFCGDGFSVDYPGKDQSLGISALNLKFLPAHAASLKPRRVCHSRHSDFGRKAHELCRGTGVEIGALYKPFDLDANVIYLDRDSTAHLQQQYAKDPTVSEIIQVNIVCKDNFYPFFDTNAFDFVINSHVLEHVTNPGRQIEEWLRIIKPGGILYMIVPDKNFCFDRRRDVTPVEHLMAEYDENVSVTSIDHYRDYIVNTNGEDGMNRDTSEEYIQACFEAQGSIHVHTFTPESIQEFFAALSKKLPFELAHFEAQGLHMHCALRKL